MAYSSYKPMRASDSAHNFINIVYPKLIALGWFSGDIRSMENHPSGSEEFELDTKYGIDAIHISSGGEKEEGIASRIQCADRVYNTFTVRTASRTGERYNIEYAKVKRLIENGDKHSLFSMHAYLTKPVGGEMLAVGVAKTVDIYDAIKDERYNKQYAHGDEFYSIKWSDVPCRTWIRAPEYDAEWLAAIEKEGERR